MHQTRSATTFRTLPLIAWAFGGRLGFVVRVRSDIPSFEEPMIRRALMRSAATCSRLGSLDRAVNRELWPLGYAAQVDCSTQSGTAVVIDVSPS